MSPATWTPSSIAGQQTIQCGDRIMHSERILVEETRTMQPECHANSCAVSFLENWRRWFAALMSAVFGLMALVGCQQPPPPIEPKPFEGVTLHVVVPNAPIVRALLLRHGNVWTEFSGA